MPEDGGKDPSQTVSANGQAHQETSSVQSPAAEEAETERAPAPVEGSLRGDSTEDLHVPLDDKALEEMSVEDRKAAKKAMNEEKKRMKKKEETAAELVDDGRNTNWAGEDTASTSAVEGSSVAVEKEQSAEARRSAAVSRLHSIKMKKTKLSDDPTSFAVRPGDDLSATKSVKEREKKEELRYENPEAEVAAGLEDSAGFHVSPVKMSTEAHKRRSKHGEEPKVNGRNATELGRTAAEDSNVNASYTQQLDYLADSTGRFRHAIEHKDEAANFLIVTQARSGASFLSGLLNTHPNISCSVQTFRSCETPPTKCCQVQGFGCLSMKWAKMFRDQEPVEGGV
ncbi:hypothetical protein CYMTET_35793, partial [Cymbomonas tetramitiformis]